MSFDEKTVWMIQEKTQFNTDSIVLHFLRDIT